jgi:hypothetical protein
MSPVPAAQWLSSRQAKSHRPCAIVHRFGKGDVVELVQRRPVELDAVEGCHAIRQG